MKTIATDKKYLVVGLGITGVSCVRYLLSENKDVSVIDSRPNPPLFDAFKSEFPEVMVQLGFEETDAFQHSDVLVLSPGVPLKTEQIQSAIASGKEVTSDIELFLNEFSGFVVGITGSNAKSTVTSWLGDAISRSGRATLIAGNIGTPVLETLNESYDIAVLELSSFQLELLKTVKADVACILNISEDHMDRYDSMAQYIQAKQKIYFGCKHAVYKRTDALTQPLVPDSVKKASFALNEPDLNQYGLRNIEGDEWICQGFDPIIKASNLSLAGRHNTENALAVIALADMAGNDRSATIASLQSFTGLPYRCQLIAEINGVRYVNDSKATNVGSVIAALEGLVSSNTKNIHLLVGGQSKGQDLSPLESVISATCKSVSAFGEDKAVFESLSALTQSYTDLASAFNAAAEQAEPGDVILLSPACASFDQYSNFEKRGEHFNELVEGLR
jgi:UDP-N-acetylmuramoylalanine--D-glutamate ligase